LNPGDFNYTTIRFTPKDIAMIYEVHKSMYTFVILFPQILQDIHAIIIKIHNDYGEEFTEKETSVVEYSRHWLDNAGLCGSKKKPIEVEVEKSPGDKTEPPIPQSKSDDSLTPGVKVRSRTRSRSSEGFNDPIQFIENIQKSYSDDAQIYDVVRRSISDLKQKSLEYLNKYHNEKDMDSLNKAKELVGVSEVYKKQRFEKDNMYYNKLQKTNEKAIEEFKTELGKL
jgi:hypothetical protein